MNVTIEDVKNTIALKGETGKILNALCDLWYKQALGEGKTELEAVMFAAYNLGEKMVKMG